MKLKKNTVVVLVKHGIDLQNESVANLIKINKKTAVIKWQICYWIATVPLETVFLLQDKLQDLNNGGHHLRSSRRSVGFDTSNSGKEKEKKASLKELVERGVFQVDVDCDSDGDCDGDCDQTEGGEEVMIIRRKDITRETRKEKIKTISSHDYSEVLHFTEPDKAWWSMYTLLEAYQRIHGDCNVPKIYGPLGRWVMNQRATFKRKKTGISVSPERRNALKNVGFEFSLKTKNGSDNMNKKNKKMGYKSYAYIKKKHLSSNNNARRAQPTTKKNLSKTVSSLKKTQKTTAKYATKKSPSKRTQAVIRNKKNSILDEKQNISSNGTIPDCKDTKIRSLRDIPVCSDTISIFMCNSCYKRFGAEEDLNCDCS